MKALATSFRDAPFNSTLRPFSSSINSTLTPKALNTPITSAFGVACPPSLVSSFPPPALLGFAVGFTESVFARFLPFTKDNKPCLLTEIESSSFTALMNASNCVCVTFATCNSLANLGYEIPNTIGTRFLVFSKPLISAFFISLLNLGLDSNFFTSTICFAVLWNARIVQAISLFSAFINSIAFSTIALPFNNVFTLFSCIFITFIFYWLRLPFGSFGY